LLRRSQSRLTPTARAVRAIFIARVTHSYTAQCDTQLLLLRVVVTDGNKSAPRICLVSSYCAKNVELHPAAHSSDAGSSTGGGGGSAGGGGSGGGGGSSAGPYKRPRSPSFTSTEAQTQQQQQQQQYQQTQQQLPQQQQAVVPLSEVRNYAGTTQLVHAGVVE
jgi:hypothetical protein